MLATSIIRNLFPAPQTRSDHASLIDYFYASEAADTITKVTPATALRCVPFWASVNFLSNSMATLPLHVYRRLPAGAKERVMDDQAEVIGRFWNDEQTAYEAMRWVMQQMCLHGVAYVQIIRFPDGRIANLFPLETRSMEVGRANGRKYYYYHPASNGRRDFERPTDRAGAIRIPPQDMLEFPFFEGDDLLEIVSPVVKCRNAIALSLALEEYASSFFRGGGMPPIVLKRPEMNKESIVRFREQMTRMFRDASRNKELVADVPLTTEILDTRMVSPSNAQMVEARRLANEEIYRVLGVQPVLLGDLSKGTYANTEQQDIQYVKHTLIKFVRQFESQISLKAFGRASDMFVEFDLKGIQRGLFKERIEGQARQFQNAMRTANELRALENLPPLADPNADKLMVQGAIMPLEMAGQQMAEPEDDAGSPDQEPENDDDESDD